MSEKLSQRTTLTFQAETSAGMTKDQLAEPAGEEHKTTVNSAPTAKTDKYEVEKGETEPPAVSKPARLKSDKPTKALTYMKKVQEEEFIKSTMLNMLVEPAGQEPETTANSAPTAKTDESEVENREAEPPDPKMTTDAASPTAAEENPAGDKPEEDKEEAVDEPTEPFTKPVVEDTPATDTPPPPIATEASPLLEPGGHKPALKDVVTAHMVIPE